MTAKSKELISASVFGDTVDFHAHLDKDEYAIASNQFQYYSFKCGPTDFANAVKLNIFKQS